MPKKPKHWSYSAGQRGRNRVRVFENRHGTLYVEYYARMPQGVKPTRVSLGHHDREKAKRQADRIAAEFGDGEPAKLSHPTLQQLFDKYLAEVTPGKGVQKQKHDERAARMFSRLFGPLRKASTLNVRDWGEFVRLRRSGALTTEHGNGRPVGDRQIEYDLKFLLAVLNWATKAQVNGERVLDSNPLRGLKLPKEKNPSRPTIDDATYQQLRAIAPSIDWRFEVALVLAHETGHRIGAICHLRWADVDFERRLVTWRATHDKSGVEHVTPLTSAAVAVLTCARRRGAAIGDGWVIPAPTRAERPCSRHVLYKWLKKGLRAIGRGSAPRIGYHCFRRKFATDLKAIPLRDLMALGSWKDPKTVVTCYQHADIDGLRDALGERAQSTHLSTHLGRESTVAR